MMNNQKSTPEQSAREMLDEWVTECRKNNALGRVELADVSNWAEKSYLIDKNCPTLIPRTAYFFSFALVASSVMEEETTKLVWAKYEINITRFWRDDSIEMMADGFIQRNERPGLQPLTSILKN
jgi:hypothetical protein